MPIISDRMKEKGKVAGYAQCTDDINTRALDDDLGRWRQEIEGENRGKEDVVLVLSRGRRRRRLVAKKGVISRNLKRRQTWLAYFKQQQEEPT